MTHSLRARLLLGVVSLVVVGLIVSDVGTYTALHSFLVGRLDDQLKNGRVAAVGFLGGQARGHDQRQAPPPPPDFPPGTIAARIAPDGTVIAQYLFFFGSTPSPARPVLPQKLPNAGPDTPTILTVPGKNGVSQYEVMIESEDSFQGDFVVVAVPLTDVQSTLGRLLLLEASITLAVSLVIAILALLIIRIGLRPLERMGAVARQIAGGDLSRRVEPATTRTEIGRLGVALNGMLSQIEAAFAERTESERRLRRFVADASHELRTPLTSIRGYAEMLRRGAARSPRDSELARRRIEEESVRMTRLVDDLLLLARLDQGRPLATEAVDLQVIARDALADGRAVAPDRSINLSAPHSVIVDGDDTRLRQVLGNLVRNALVHTPSGTPVEIAVSSEDGLGRLTVADHGGGLRADERERIFEPFYRADPSRSRDNGGAGLGLSIVTAVVAAHGGQVRVRETDGGGATFEVELALRATEPSMDETPAPSKL